MQPVWSGCQLPPSTSRRIHLGRKGRGRPLPGLDAGAMVVFLPVPGRDADAVVVFISGAWS